MYHHLQATRFIQSWFKPAILDLDFRNRNHETELASVCLKFPYIPFEHNVQVNNVYEYKMH